MRLRCRLLTPYRLVQQLKHRHAHSRTKGEVGRGSVDFSTPRALRGQRAGHGTPILDSDCTFIFTVLLLLVEGLEVFAALSFDTVVMLILVVVVTRCRAEESSRRGGSRIEYAGYKIRRCVVDQSIDCGQLFWRMATFQAPRQL